VVFPKAGCETTPRTIQEASHGASARFIADNPDQTILRYGIAVLSVAAATGSSLLLTHAGVTLTPFLMAVGVNRLVRRNWAGVLAIVFSVLNP